MVKLDLTYLRNSIKNARCAGCELRLWSGTNSGNPGITHSVSSCGGNLPSRKKELASTLSCLAFSIFETDTMPLLIITDSSCLTWSAFFSLISLSFSRLTFLIAEGASLPREKVIGHGRFSRHESRRLMEGTLSDEVTS